MIKLNRMIECWYCHSKFDEVEGVLYGSSVRENNLGRIDWKGEPEYYIWCPICYNRKNGSGYPEHLEKANPILPSDTSEDIFKIAKKRDRINVWIYD